jgi:hypothetical protein
MEDAARIASTELIGWLVAASASTSRRPTGCSSKLAAASRQRSRPPIFAGRKIDKCFLPTRPI